MKSAVKIYDFFSFALFFSCSKSNPALLPVIAGNTVDIPNDKQVCSAIYLPFGMLGATGY